jgi:hypothetical protein
MKRTGCTSNLLMPVIVDHHSAGAVPAALGDDPLQQARQSGRLRRPATTRFIEVVWTLVPVLILVGIAIPSIDLLAKQFKPCAGQGADGQGHRQPVVLELHLSRQRRLRSHFVHAEPARCR